MKQLVLNEYIDSQKIGRYQVFILGICLLLMIMDGYDIQAMAYAAPFIIEDWGVDKPALGMAFSASILGLFIGSLTLSWCSDKFGRRPILMLSTLAFSILMIATPHVTSIEQLTVIRFITGIFLGGIMPNAMAYSSEIVPNGQRVFAMILISTGYTIGGMIGGFISAWLTPIGGWHAIFYFGGVIPLIIFVIMLFTLPESLRYMGAKKENHDKIRYWLNKMFPNCGITNTTEIIHHADTGVKPSPLQLFKGNRAFFTTTIWIISALNMMSLYFLASWLPTLGKESGLSMQNAMYIGSTLLLGGTIGSVMIALKINKLGFYKVLIPVFIVAVISVGLIGFTSSVVPLMFLAVFVAGFAVVGGQPAINALSADYYPIKLRTTGVGWSIGIGRLGSVIAPVFGGYLSTFLTINHLFLIAAIPSVTIIGILLIQLKSLRSNKAVSNVEAASV
ncbi:MFS transporter [Psychrobacter sp. FDAARGOS_221]|uniref:MFS transporter n=1 Tax=Psychrobacter sp. FDAARGOS_221 TaxID=1975705 RepID=UPI000BB57CE1|nr:MFS transporter [Psychrobacter sp. FDAARGOS_221]PNK59702.1 MFS transporter [Psychrobacter sp. FDAARGOS_221]